MDTKLDVEVSEARKAADLDAVKAELLDDLCNDGAVEQAVHTALDGLHDYVSVNYDVSLLDDDELMYILQDAMRSFVE